MVTGVRGLFPVVSQYKIFSGRYAQGAEVIGVPVLFECGVDGVVPQTGGQDMSWEVPFVLPDGRVGEGYKAYLSCRSRADSALA